MGDFEVERPAEEVIAELIGELLELKLQTHDTWAKEQALVGQLNRGYGVRHEAIDRRVLEALADRWNLQSLSTTTASVEAPCQPNQGRRAPAMLVHGFLP